MSQIPGPTPYVSIDPEAMRRFQAHLDEVAAAWQRLVDAFLPLLEARMTEVAQALNTAAEAAEQTRPADERPAHQSPYGPAHQKRGRR